MKYYIGIVIASILIGFASFIITYRLFKFSYDDSLTLGWVIGITGLIVELLRPLIVKLTKKGAAD